MEGQLGPDRKTGAGRKRTHFKGCWSTRRRKKKSKEIHERRLEDITNMYREVVMPKGAK